MITRLDALFGKKILKTSLFFLRKGIYQLGKITYLEQSTVEEEKSVTGYLVPVNGKLNDNIVMTNLFYFWVPKADFGLLRPSVGAMLVENLSEFDGNSNYQIAAVEAFDMSDEIEPFYKLLLERTIQ